MSSAHLPSGEAQEFADSDSGYVPDAPRPTRQSQVAGGAHNHDDCLFRHNPDDSELEAGRQFNSFLRNPTSVQTVIDILEEALYGSGQLSNNFRQIVDQAVVKRIQDTTSAPAEARARPGARPGVTSRSELDSTPSMRGDFTPSSAPVEDHRRSFFGVALASGLQVGPNMLETLDQGLVLAEYLNELWPEPEIQVGLGKLKNLPADVAWMGHKTMKLVEFANTTHI